MHPDSILMVPKIKDERLAMLQAWDLAKVKAKLIKEKIAKTDVEADGMIAEYRKYMALYVIRPGERFPMSVPLDPVWHMHIICTKDYAAFCQTVFGRFLHHDPSVTEEELVVVNKRFEELKGFYREYFGDSPYWWGCGRICGCDAPGGCDGGGACQSGCR